MDPLLSTRRAMLAALKASADVLAIVPKARIFPQTAPSVPDWPFVKLGAPSDVPRSASCLDGSEIIVAVHGFAGDRVVGGSVAETAEDHCIRLAGAIRSALHRNRLALEGGGYGVVTFTNRQILQDGDAAHYHAVVNFRVRVTR